MLLLLQSVGAPAPGAVTTVGVGTVGTSALLLNPTTAASVTTTAVASSTAAVGVEAIFPTDVA